MTQFFEYVKMALMNIKSNKVTEFHRREHGIERHSRDLCADDSQIGGDPLIRTGTDHRHLFSFKTVLQKGSCYLVPVFVQLPIGLLGDLFLHDPPNCRIVGIFRYSIFQQTCNDVSIIHTFFLLSYII